VPEHEDFQMHEDVIPGIDGGQAGDAHHQADKPVQRQDIPARPQQADVDDDMEEDEEVRCTKGPHNAVVSAHASVRPNHPASIN